MSPNGCNMSPSPASTTGRSLRGASTRGAGACVTPRSARPTALCAWGPRTSVALAMSAGVLVPSADRSVAAPLDRGAQLAAVCASCHRLDGGDHGIPSIVGLDEATLVAEMTAFKSGERTSQIMRVMSLSLTADDVRAVARYLAAQRKDTHPQ
jgi:cytochrome subunit of sulfide dehydrogenase